MASQIFSDLGIYPENWPKTKVYVEVIEKQYTNLITYWSRDNIKRWLDEIQPGDVILLEYPLVYDMKQSGYGKSYVYLTNTRTEGGLKLKIGKLGYIFWYNIVKFKILNN